MSRDAMSEPTRWGPWHDRLHRQLLHEPQLLPDGQALLLAVSGGQDSMALMSLLVGMRHLHSWNLSIWHGDHGWHERSGEIARNLANWCRSQNLPVQVSQASTGEAGSEATARKWRYQELQKLAERESRDVVTGHTATDRAETILLQMARGSDLAGLGSLRSQRPLEATRPKGPQLRRPLLQFNRSETAAICRDLHLPIWIDPSNNNPGFARNRIRQQVFPVLEDLHPGSTSRMANLAERLSQVRDSQWELSVLALQQLRNSHRGLNRRALGELQHPTRRTLLATWLKQQGVPTIDASLLEQLSHRLALGEPGGRCDLPGRWTLHWQGADLLLSQF